MESSKILLPKTLLIIDVQKGFLDETTEGIVDDIRKIISMIEPTRVLASKFINQPDGPFVNYLNWRQLIADEEQKIPDEIVESIDKVFPKHTYSCLTPELASYLHSNSITSVALCGMDTDACLLATALDLFSNHIEPYVLAQGCRSARGDEYHQMALKILARNIGSQRIIKEIL